MENSRKDAPKAVSEVFRLSRTVKKTKDLRVGTPDKPVGLSARADAEWDRLMRELDDSGIQLTRGHRSWLELASTIAADMADAAARVKKDGAYRGKGRARRPSRE